MTSTRRLKNILRGVIAAVFWITVWALCARAVGKELILPGPFRVARTLVSLAGTETFWKSILTTFLRILTGYAAGVALASVLAVLTFSNKAADALLSPVIRIVRATPVASFIIHAAVYERMYTMITDKAAQLDAVNAKIDAKKQQQHAQSREELMDAVRDFEIDEAVPDDEYVYFNGKMVKNGVMKKLKREAEGLPDE